jgi:hypothetical protein
MQALARFVLRLSGLCLQDPCKQQAGISIQPPTGKHKPSDKEQAAAWLSLPHSAVRAVCRPYAGQE